MSTIALVILLSVFTAVLTLVTLFLLKMVRREVKDSQSEFLQLARQQFEAEQNKAATELETRKQAVEGSIASLKEQLQQYRDMVRAFEQDRTEKYGSLANELKNASLSTAKLQETTNNLNNILGNNQKRGQWGERMAEDIVRFAGLIEGVNYRKQTKLDSTTTKPDYTFLLPDEHTINMDVKFPLNNYTAMVQAATPEEAERCRKEFERNVKARIKEIQGRDYINPAEKTLDFVLLFIPNEQIFGFIQEQMPEISDEALRQKVVLCSPFTLCAMLSVVRQAFENFRFERDLKKILVSMDQFAKSFELFKKRFETIGASIEKLATTYNDVRDKSFKQLDTRLKQIEAYKQGQALSAGEGSGLLESPQEEPFEEDAIL